MNNEIKEILKILKKCEWSPCLTKHDATILLDYITNLQTIEQQYSAILSENAELENKITNLQEELKSANESITWWTNRFNALQEENKKWQNQLIEMTNIAVKNKNKINKAIEYIKSFGSEWKNYSLYYNEIMNKLLNILEGDNNE